MGDHIQKPGDLPARRVTGNDEADGVIRSWSGCFAPCWLHPACPHGIVAVSVELLICLTCKRGFPADRNSDPGGPRPGSVLMARVAGREPAGVTVRGVECLSNCTRGCSVALRGGSVRWAYVYGDIDPDLHVSALLDGAARYAATPDGLIPWRERPEILRKGVIARIPPMEAP